MNETSKRKVRSVLLTMILIVSSVTVGMSGAALAKGGFDADPATNQSVSDGGVYWKGADLKYSDSNLGTDTEVTVYEKNSDGEDKFVGNYNSVSGSPEYVEFEANSEYFGTGGHYLEYTDESTTDQKINFELQEHDMSVDLANPDDEDKTIENEGPNASDTKLDIEFSSNRGSYKIHVYDKDDELSMSELKDLFQDNGTEKTDSDGTAYYELSGSNSNTYTLDFDKIETGELNLKFESIDSGAKGSISFEVVEKGDVEATFSDENNLTEPRGDIATFTVDLKNTDEFKLQFGELDSDGYNYTAKVDAGDEEQVKLHFDSSKAGDQVNPFSIDDETDGASFTHSPKADMKLDDPLVPLAYQIELKVDGERTDLGSLNLTERTTKGITTMVAPKSASLNDVGDIKEKAVASDQATVKEQVVLKLETTGLQHLFNGASASDFNKGNSIYNKGIILEFKSAEDQVNNTDGGLKIGSSSAYLDDEEHDNLNEGEYYFVFDVSNKNDIDAEDVYEASFEIQNKFEYYQDDDYDADDVREEATDEIRFYEQKVTLEENQNDLVEIPAVEDSKISATTTMAPGTEVQTTIKSGSPHTLVNTKTVEVSEDRMIETSFDLSAFETDHEFDLTFGGANEQYDAIAVEPGVGSYNLDVTVENQSGEVVPATVSVEADSLVTPDGEDSSSDDSTSDNSSSDDSTDSSSDDSSSDDSTDSSSDDSSSDDSTSDDSTSDDSTSDDSSSDDSSDSSIQEKDQTVEEAPVTFEDLTEGEYTVTATPQDEELLESTESVTLDADKQITVTVSEPEPEPETYSLTVEVLDKSTSEPVSGAEVSIGGQSSTTGENGQATLQLEEGSFSVTANADGYTAGTSTGEISSDKTTTVQLEQSGSSSDDGGSGDEGSSGDGSSSSDDGGSGPLPGQPGFGAVISLVALLGAALLAARRER